MGRGERASARDSVGAFSDVAPHRQLDQMVACGKRAVVFLVKHSMCVVTDSGGITEETTVLGIPCMTLRDSTERPETVSVGTNELLGTNPSALRPAFQRLFAGQWKKGSIPLKWDGRSGDRIVTVLQTLLTNKPA